MFEFNREFILNDISNVKLNSDSTVLIVPKMINIEKSKVRKVYHAPYIPAVNEKIVLPAASTLNGTLVITIGQEGRVISLVSSRDAQNQKDYIFNGAPADWQAQFERQAAMEDMDRLIDLEADGKNLTISAKDCYTRVLKVVYENADGSVKQEWSRKAYWQGQAGTGVAPTWVATFTPGSEGMGTVARLQKNNRVLTAANITPYGFDMDERPVPGGKYHQFTVHYVSERRQQSGEVFGSINHSLVTLIFFVLDADAKTFEGYLAKLGTVVAVGSDSDSNDIPGVQGAAPAATDVLPAIEAKEDILPHDVEEVVEEPGGEDEE